MRGRTQATAIALLGTFVPLLTPATIALVTLRKGAVNGLVILFWGLLPMLGYLGMSQINPLMPVLVINGLITVYVAAVILRTSISWAYTLTGLVALAGMSALFLLLVIPTPLMELGKSIADVMTKMYSELQPPQTFETPGSAFWVGMLAYTTAISALFGLLIGRWWQALLYNPGGFAEEFRGFRLSPAQALLCLGAAIFCFVRSDDYLFWGILCEIPLLVMGVAIFHQFAAVRRLGSQWLVLFYIGLILVNLIAQLLALVAFLDTWLNFRGRFKPKQ